MTAAIDLFAGSNPGVGTAAQHGVAVTPSDSTDLTNVTRWVYTGTGGDIKVTLRDGTTLIIPGTTAGVMLPIMVSRIWAAGTTVSSGICAFW